MKTSHDRVIDAEFNRDVSQCLVVHSGWALGLERSRCETSGLKAFVENNIALFETQSASASVSALSSGPSSSSASVAPGPALTPSGGTAGSKASSSISPTSLLAAIASANSTSCPLSQMEGTLSVSPSVVCG